MSRALYLEGGIDRANARKSAPQANQKKEVSEATARKCIFRLQMQVQTSKIHKHLTSQWYLKGGVYSKTHTHQHHRQPTLKSSRFK
jgi:hypothetical protein